MGDRGNTTDLDPFDQFGLPGLAHRDDHRREACLSRQSGGQNATYGEKATIQPALAQQDCAAQLLGWEDSRSEDRSDNRKIKRRDKPYLDQWPMGVMSTHGA